MFLTKCTPDSSRLINLYSPVLDEVDDYLNRFRIKDRVETKHMNAPLSYQENKSEIILKIEMPGLKNEDFDLSIDKNLLTVKGEKKEEKEEGEKYYGIERRYGTFSRTIKLTSVIREDDVKATYRDGILKINIPKKEEPEPKIIPIES